MNKEQWVITPKKNNNAKVKLLCFPYAGGGVPIYFPWNTKLSEDIELNIVQLPGRGTNFINEPIDNMDQLIEVLLPLVGDLLHGNYIIFGHSLGSRVGFELVRRAIAKGFPAPLHFFVSGSASPKQECFGERIHDLSDEQFVRRLKKMNGTPPEVIENKELMSLFLPTLRADFKIAELYFCPEEFTIPTDVTVLSGNRDSISDSELATWGDYFLGFELRMCDGDHFFIDTHPEQVIEAINNVFDRVSSKLV